MRWSYHFQSWPHHRLVISPNQSLPKDNSTILNFHLVEVSKQTAKFVEHFKCFKYAWEISINFPRHNTQMAHPSTIQLTKQQSPCAHRRPVGKDHFPTWIEDRTGKVRRKSTQEQRLEESHLRPLKRLKFHFYSLGIKSIFYAGSLKKIQYLWKPGRGESR